MSSDLLRELVSHYSPSGQETGAVAYLVTWLSDHGFDAWIDGAGNACGARGPVDAPTTLVLLGHIDTVPGEIPVREEEGWLWGRGTVDAKGSLCAFAEATSQAALPPDLRVLVIGAVGEEADSPGAQFIREQIAPDVCIIGEPSGANRITLGYKGHLLVDYTLACPRVHSSREEPTAAERGVRLWQAITAWADEQNAGFERAFDQVLPHLAQINTTSDGFADTLHMTVSFRLPERLSPEDTFAAVEALAERDGFLHAGRAAPAYQESKNNPLVRGLLAAIRAQDHKPAFVLKGGTSDMNVVCARWTCPIVAYGPGDSALDHTPEERIELTEYDTAVATLRYLLEHFSVPVG